MTVSHQLYKGFLVHTETIPEVRKVKCV